MRSDLAARVADATFVHLGEAAVYTPPGGGDGVACSVRTLGGDEIGEVDGGSRIRREARALKVRAAEVTPAEGGTFALEAGGSYQVYAAPRREDPERLVWTCQVVPA